MFYVVLLMLELNSFRPEEKLIVLQFRKSVTCNQSTEIDHQHLTYLDEMVDGKALTVSEQPNVTNQFIIQICSFCLVLTANT